LPSGGASINLHDGKEVLVRCLLLATTLFAALGGGCKAKVPEITGPFSDDFERAEVGPGWLDTSGAGRIEQGRLNVKGAHNRPVWLRQRLPRDVVIEIDAMSKSPEGDLKIELYGDGESFDPDQGRYDPTGYVMFFGGHHNTESVIGRLGEHDAEIKARRTDKKVEPGRVYRWTITRKGGRLDWRIDGEPFLSFDDPEPLFGERRQFFAITNWETDVHFDNLRIRPAP
jgi:hypothetical protein